MPDIPNAHLELRGLSYRVKVPPPKGAPVSQKLPWAAPQHADILRNVSVTCAPGTMTLVLAPPSSGSTTLLRMLAGRLPAEGISGDLLLNGKPFHEVEAAAGRQQHPQQAPEVMPTSRDAVASTPGGTIVKAMANPHRMIQYIGQEDLHFPNLSVRETLQFAQNAANAHSKHGPEGLEAFEANQLDTVLDFLALHNAADTPVGNDIVRGVSGGERKRTTVGEMMVAYSRALLMDQVTSGLDSATATDLMRTLRIAAKVARMTIVCALQQPTPEMFECFTHLVLMRDGAVVYSGRRDGLDAWMNSLGLRVPDDEDTADFLMEFLTAPLSVYERQLLEHQAGLDAAQAAAAAAGAAESSAASADDVDATAADHSAEVAPPDVALPGNQADLIQAGLNSLYAQVPAGTSLPEEFSKRAALDRAFNNAHQMGYSTAALSQYCAWFSQLQQQVAAAIAAAPAEDRPAAHEEAAEQPSTRASRSNTAGSLSEAPGLNMALLDSDLLPNGVMRPLAGQPTDSLSLHLHSDFAVQQYGSRYAHGLTKQVEMSLRREIVSVSRNKAYLRGRFGQVAMSALICGCAFWQISEAQALQMVGVLFFALLATSFSNFSEVPFTAASKRVVVKQREASMYSGAAYVVSMVMVNLCIAALESVVFTCILYFMVGFDQSADTFFYFLALMYVSAITMGSMFRTIVLAAPTEAAAQTMTGPLVGVSAIFAGLVVAADRIPDFLIWLHYLSPLSWVLRAGAQNEFKNERYDTPLPPSGQRAGDAYLDAYGIQKESIWRVAVFLYLIGFFILMNILSIRVMTRVRPRTPAGRPLRLSDSEAKEMRTARRARGRVQPDQTVVQVEGADGDDKLEPSRALSSTADLSSTALPFKRVRMVWRDVRYEVDTPKGPRQLLCGIHGYVEPGTVVALMGSSGAGKTTLLDVLAQRKTTGRIAGEITVNGVSVKDTAFQRFFAYVEQFDTHLPFATVREAVRFSADMQLPADQRKDSAVVAKFVDEIIHVLELDDVADDFIGGTASAIGQNIGLTDSQRKRVTIAVQLAANPSVLFLDEPTTGLDGRSAQTVMRVVRRVAAQGRAVLCTIHQPSAAVFFCFHELLLLRSGGQQVYLGPLGARAANLERYLEAIPGTPPLPSRVNPADWMLRVLRDADVETEKVPAGTDFRTSPSATWRYSQAYRDSELCAQNLVRVEAALHAPMDGAGQLKQASNNLSERYAAGFGLQAVELMKRAQRSILRNQAYGFLRFRIAVVLGIIFALTFSNTDSHSQSGLVSVVGGLYMGCTFISIASMMSVLPVLFENRASFEREKASRLYSPLVSAAVDVLAELPWILLSVAAFNALLYFSMGLPNKAFSGYLIVVVSHWFLVMSLVLLSHVIVSLTPGPAIAQLALSLCITVTNLMSGYFSPPFATPASMRWIIYLNPIYYFAEIAIITASECDDCAPVPVVVGKTPLQLTPQGYMETVYGMDKSDLGFDMVILMAVIPAVLLVAKLVAVKLVNWTQR